LYYNCCDEEYRQTSPYAYQQTANPVPGMSGMPGMMQPTTMPMYQPGVQMEQPIEPGMEPTFPTAPVAPTGVAEESYIENILRYNKGKIGTFYYTVEGSNEWNSVVFRGRVETAGRDHLIITDPKTGRRFLLLMINLSWAEFDEELAYPYIPTPENITLVTRSRENRREQEEQV
jgi:spore germination protein Q